MDTDILFKEKQKFRQWWMWLILLSVNIFFLYGIYRQVVMGKTFGDNPMSNAALIIVTVLTFGITLLFQAFRLETIIKKDGIYVRFFPFHLRYNHYAWHDLTRCFVRKYSPLREYGGWGIRIGLGGKGKAYNVSGNQGLQLEFTTGKRLLIGTNKPEEVTKTLEQINELKT